MRSLFYALLGSSMIISGCASSNLIMGIYNPKDGLFESKNTRLDEKVINRHIEDFNIKDLQLYAYADFLEGVTRFSRLRRGPAVYWDSLITERIENNLKLIAKVDTSKDPLIEKQYPAIKKVTSELDSLYNENPNSDYERFENTYIHIGKNIDDMRDNTNLTLEEVLSGKGGVCLDMVSTYCPFLLYYGFDARFEADSIIGDKDYHTWINMKNDENEFDLDPTWYDNEPIPLKARLPKTVINIPERQLITRKEILKEK